MLEGCRKQNMVVLARTDPHATYQDVYDAHPDWIAVDAQGHKRPHPDYPGMWLTCALGPYNFEFMTDVTREIVTMYRREWRLQQSLDRQRHVLLRDIARRNFRAAFNSDLPRTRDPRDPVYRNYVVWEQQQRSLSCGGCGIQRFARPAPMRGTLQTQAVARLAGSI